MEDLFSVCNIAFIKALRSFKIDKGVKFAAYLAKCCMNEIFMLYRKDNKHLSTVSIFETIGHTDKDEIYLLDIIKKEYDFDGNVNGEAILVIMENVLRKLDENKQALIKEALFEGGTEKELAEKYKISQSYVSRIMKRFKENLMKKLLQKGLIDAPIKIIKHKGEKKMSRELSVNRDYIEKRTNEGATAKEIAAEINAPVNTVGYHVRKINGVTPTKRIKKDKVAANRDVETNIPNIDIAELVTVRGNFAIAGEVENAAAISKQINYLLALSKNKKASFSFSIEF